MLPRTISANIISIHRCGPCKLAKAFKFCLGNNLNSSHTTTSGELKVEPFCRPSPPLTTPLGGLGSPQSLFNLSPESDNCEDKPTYEYFPTRPVLPDRSSASSKTIRPVDSLDAGLKVIKTKPILLLVEDNEINMRVCCNFDVHLGKILPEPF